MGEGIGSDERALDNPISPPKARTLRSNQSCQTKVLISEEK